MADGGVQWFRRVGVEEVDAREGITEGGVGVRIGGRGGVFGPGDVIGCFRMETRWGDLSTLDRTLKPDHLHKRERGAGRFSRQSGEQNINE